MLNLLPLIDKKKVRMEYRLRLAVVLVFGLAFLVFANSALLVPSYIRAFSKHSLATEQLASVVGRGDIQSARDSAEKEATIKIREVNKKLSLFTSGEKKGEEKLVPSEAFRKIIGLKTSAIKIFGITYEVSLERERFVITGKSANRDSLRSFVDALKKDGLFTAVELPISSYVKSVDIEFSITVDRVNKKAVSGEQPK